MIRVTTPADTPTLIALAEETGVFKPLEIVALGEVLADYHATNEALGHCAATYVAAEGRITGLIYYAPAAMTERSWYLYWIVVAKSQQGQGIGSELMQFAEADIRARSGRIVFIETSSLPHYDLTRRFYRNLQYQQEAVLRDYYANGDDMIVFRKRLDG